jgi:hypothetical protein
METAERDEAYTVMQPVTTYRTVYSDQGGFMDQTTVTPGPTKTRLKWLPRAEFCDPVTGQATYQRPGLAWVPEQCPATVTVNRVWVPNVVAQQVPQTSYVQSVATRKVPVQVCRTVNEEVVRKVPVQVCRVVQEEQVRRVPVTTYKQVVERVEQQTPVQVCRMVEEEVVRRIPVTTCRMVTEERVDQIPVKTCRMEAVQQTVQVPRVVCKKVPVVYTQRVPRVVCMRVPVEDPCAPSCCGESTGVVLAPAPAVAAPVQVAPAPAAPQGTFAPSSPTPAQEGTQSGQGNATQKPELDPKEEIGPVDDAPFDDAPFDGAPFDEPDLKDSEA